MRQHQIVRHGQPGHADHKDRRDIGEERKRQPSQHRSVARVAHEHFEQYRDDRKAGDVENRWSGDQKAQRGGHGAEIGADIDRVGDDEEPDQQIQQGRWVVAAHVSSKTPPRHPADLRADHLNRAHQRIGQKQRPTEAVAELRAGLGIGRDAARVIVRSAGDQAGPKHVPQFRPVRLLDLVGRGLGLHIHGVEPPRLR